MFLLYKKGNVCYTTESNNDLEIINESNENHTRIIVEAKERVELCKAYIDLDYKFNKSCNLFFNGYQSWTDSFELNSKSKEKNINKPFLRKKVCELYGLNKYGDSTFYKYKRNILHGYDIFYSKGNKSVFIYSLNYVNAYLIFEYQKDKFLRLTSDIEGKVLEKGQKFVIFDYKQFDNYYLGLESFNNDFKKNNERIFGYSSWYNMYQNINEKLINDCLDALDDRFNLFQIDDGYETKVGDWLSIDNTKFPNGLKPIVEKIHSKGLKAGIWVAPFAAEINSKLAIEHPDWLIKKNNKPVKCGVNWGGFYSLDLTNEDAKKYIIESLNYYKSLGFDFFKLDFVYAASVVVPNGYTRAEWQEYTYRFLRENLSDKLILGCGANIFNSFNNFDYLRVGPDVSFKFDDVPYMRLLHRERNSTKNTIQNTIYRSIFDHHLFLNDSDVFLLRDDNIELTLEQRKALITINALFSSVLMTSDNISEYDEYKNNLLTDSLNLFLNAKDVKFQKEKENINISYTLDGSEETITYDTIRGVLNGR